MGPVSFYPVAMRAQELEVVQVVRPSPRLRDYMVNLEYLEREVHPAPRTSALLLPKKDVLILPVVYRSVYVGPLQYVRSDGYIPNYRTLGQYPRALAPGGVR